MARDWTKEYFGINGDEPDYCTELEKELERTKKQLDIAIKRLEFLKKKTAAPYDLPAFKPIYEMCNKTLKEIKETN